MSKIAILISGRGSNMTALLNAIKTKNLDCHVVCVIANKKSQGLKFAAKRNIPTRLIERNKFDSKETHEIKLIDVLLSYQPDWILLAGYMAILSPTIIEVFGGKIINIHPSLLPKFKGLDTHRRAMEAREIKHGTTIHIVTNELDGGPIIAQSEITVLPSDTSETLRHRVLKEEHILYPLVLEALTKKYLEIKSFKVIWHKTPPMFELKNKAIEVSVKPFLKIKNIV